MPHTPGPWVVIEREGGFVIHNPTIDSDGGTDLYDPIVWEMGGIDSIGNAQLIAAAPDLLAACQKALAFHNRYCDRVGPAEAWANTVHSALRAAVAKATMEPS